jgi:purine-nucleoside phosphorylase
VITNKILRKEGPIHDTRSTGIFNIYYCDATLSSIASERIKQAGFSPVPGDCLTTERFVHRREKKAWIHSIFNVHVVEMESIALAAVFNAAHIPFINVRVVSDTSMKTIVNYEAVVALRRKSGWGGIADYFLRNPGEIMRGVQFRINMLKAKKTMLQVVTILVNGLPDTI